MVESELISTLRGKVQRYLGEMDVTYEVVKATYRIRYESTAVILAFLESGESETILGIRGIVLSNVKKQGNEAMFEEFNDLNRDYYFAKVFWWAYDEKPGEGNVWCLVNTPGENLDFEEFRRLVVHVANVADELDDKLMAKYGGERFID